MIASGYSVDLYCDITECARRGRQAQIFGETWQDCARQARAKGWLISRDRTRCVCPACVAAGKRMPPAAQH